MLTSNNISELKRLCRTYRIAIELALNNGCFQSDFCFRRFPSGCCDEACDLLHLHLLDYGYESISMRGEYCGTNLEERYPHVWLAMRDGTIADITGDRFSDGRVPIRCVDSCYVGPMDAFHAQFDQALPLPSQETYSIEALNRIQRRRRMISRYLPK